MGRRLDGLPSETLAESARKLSMMIYHYPRILDTAGEVRLALDRLVTELGQHAMMPPEHTN
jgi:hypothetical protein